jgi:hypothetical protein
VNAALQAAEKVIAFAFRREAAEKPYRCCFAFALLSFFGISAGLQPCENTANTRALAPGLPSVASQSTERGAF